MGQFGEFVPQGLKPFSFSGYHGTAEAVPFKTRATDPSTPFGAKNAPNFSQDDSLFWCER